MASVSDKCFTSISKGSSQIMSLSVQPIFKIPPYYARNATKNYGCALSALLLDSIVFIWTILITFLLLYFDTDSILIILLYVCLSEIVIQETHMFKNKAKILSAKDDWKVGSSEYIAVVQFFNGL